MVQARLTLVQYLYRETLRGLASALAMSQQPPLRPEEKEFLFGKVERTVWDIPDDFFADPPMDDAGWGDRAGDDPRIRAALEDGITAVLAGRRRAGIGP